MSVLPFLTHGIHLVSLKPAIHENCSMFLFLSILFRWTTWCLGDDACLAFLGLYFMLCGTLPWPPNEARLAFKEGQLPEAQVLPLPWMLRLQIWSQPNANQVFPSKQTVQVDWTSLPPFAQDAWHDQGRWQSSGILKSDWPWRHLRMESKKHIISWLLHFQGRIPAVMLEGMCENGSTIKCNQSPDLIWVS